MIKQMELATQWLKEQPVKGCITGSSLLGYFPDSHQDIDIFIYDEKSFTKLLFAMYHNDMFQILDPLEQWKFDRHINKNYDNYRKQGLITIKFTYNTVIPINIILKKNKDNIFAVLSSFDMDIISKGYDIETKQWLDLTDGSTESKIASWNKWNTSFYNPEIWQVNRILRQLERVFKYHNRGYNTDNLVHKYIELIDGIQKYQNIFNSNNFTEKLKITKQNTKVIKKLCEVWLKTHIITEEQIELLKIKIKEI